ncbi:MAG: hypothetical protein R3D30_00715 [Hyphomicrobiales bacterium]
MSKLATLMVAVGALALTIVTLSPSSAEAGWRRWGRGPGVSVYVGPRYGYYAPRSSYYYRPYRYSYGYGYPYAYYPYWRGRYWRGWY